MRIKTIMSSNKDICEKLNQLHIKNRVDFILNDYKPHYIKKIIATINKRDNILDYKIDNEKIIISKIPTAARGPAMCSVK